MLLEAPQPIINKYRRLQQTYVSERYIAKEERKERKASLENSMNELTKVPVSHFLLYELLFCWHISHLAKTADQSKCGNNEVNMIRCAN